MIPIKKKKILKRKDFKKRGKYFPGDPVAKTLSVQCRGPRFDPWLGNDPTGYK